MKKFFFLFLLSLSNVTFAASDIIVDAVTCKTFEGKDLKLIFVPESQLFSLSLDNAVVVETTIDKIYLQPYATQSTIYFPPKSGNNRWFLVREDASDKTGYTNVSLDIRQDQSGKLIKRYQCKKETISSMLMEFSADGREVPENIESLMHQ